jgi:ADP-dependent NAD(P)H-hydrate dehydratase / NAD(P)H-hydrate epimerase
MQPIVTPEEMAAVDRDAPEPVEVLIGRAGSAVMRHAIRMMGGAYGRRVLVVAGKGNNGNDGRDAAARLRARGVRVALIDAASAEGTRLPAADLVIDAAYGTGFRGEYHAPDPGDAAVLAVDIPSGVNGRTGEAGDGAVRADETVSFAALKPGLVLQPGRQRAGRVHLVDIGLDVSRATVHLVQPSDVVQWLPRRPLQTHKWRAALWIVAGSPGMTGAAALASRGAQRTGAGYVRLSIPGASSADATAVPIEVVRTELPSSAWDGPVLDGLARFKALVVGPGLGTEPVTIAAVRRVVRESTVPSVVDGDALTALGSEVARYAHPLSVLTPHDGEYERLAGHLPVPDRITAARDLAASTTATVLLKGSTTVVADSEGRVLVSTTGDARLATAGTGDVLSGVIGSLLAQGVHPLRAAAAGAWLHGMASTLGPRRGLVAGDVAQHLPEVLDGLEA